MPESRIVRCLKSVIAKAFIYSVYAIIVATPKPEGCRARNGFVAICRSEQHARAENCNAGEPKAAVRTI